MAKTPEAALKFMDASGARRDGEGCQPKPRTSRRSSTRRRAASQLQPWDWEFYSEQVRKAKYDLDEVAGEALLRAEQRAAERRLLCRQPALRHHLQGAQRHSGLQPGRARLRGLRRRRQAAGALLLRLLQARQQERRRLDGQSSSASPSCWARCRWSTTSPTSPSRRRASRRCSASTT